MPPGAFRHVPVNGADPGATAPARPTRVPRPARAIVPLAVAPALRWLVAADSVPAGRPRRTGCDT